jgi:hypothetical protein
LKKSVEVVTDLRLDEFLRGGNLQAGNTFLR